MFDNGDNFGQVPVVVDTDLGRRGVGRWEAESNDSNNNSINDFKGQNNIDDFKSTVKSWSVGTRNIVGHSYLFQ